MLIAGGMSYHGARRLTGKISKVVTECRSEIAKERNERARSVCKEKRAEEREVLIKVVKALWSEDKRSVADGHTRPIEYCLSSKRRMLSYKNARLKVADTAKRGQMRLGAWRIYVSDKLSMSESKIERESSGLRRGSSSRGWQISREVVQRT
jgi:hypothetical protein